MRGRPGGRMNMNEASDRRCSNIFWRMLRHEKPGGTRRSCFLHGTLRYFKEYAAKAAMLFFLNHIPSRVPFRHLQPQLHFAREDKTIHVRRTESGLDADFSRKSRKNSELRIISSISARTCATITVAAPVPPSRHVTAKNRSTSRGI